MRLIMVMRQDRATKTAVSMLDGGAFDQSAWRSRLEILPRDTLSTA